MQIVINQTPCSNKERLSPNTSDKNFDISIQRLDKKNLV